MDLETFLISLHVVVDEERPAGSFYETAREMILNPCGFFGDLPPEYDSGPNIPALGGEHVVEGTARRTN